MSRAKKFSSSNIALSRPIKLSSKGDSTAYAETVFRTIQGADGKVKDQFASAMRELKITQKDIADL